MANVTMKFDAETAKAVQGFLQIEDRQKSLEERTRRLAESSRHASDTGKTGADRWADGLTSLVTRYASVAGAIGIAAAALRSLNEESKRSAETAMTGAEARGSLAQMATSPADLRRMVSESQLSEHETGMSAAEAARLQFALESAGKTDRRSFYARARGVVASPAELADQVATIQGAMTLAETGGDEAVVSKLLLASSRTKSAMPELAKGLARMGKPASMLGASDEEAMAALAITSRGEVSADVMSTQLSSFAVGAMRQGIGGGLLGATQQISQRGMTDKKLIKFLGSIEAVKGYQGLRQNMQEIEGLTGELSAPGVEGLIGQKIAAYEDVFGLEKNLASARAGRRVAEEKTLSRKELQAQYVIERVMEEMLERDYPGVARWQAQKILGVGKFFGESPERLAGYYSLQRGPHGDFSAELLEEIKEQNETLKTIKQQLSAPMRVETSSGQATRMGAGGGVE
jgi:hypothetical protein